MRNLLFITIAATLLAAVIYGCTDERSTNPFGGSGDSGTSGCLGCHGDREFLESVLAEEGGRLAKIRSDG